MAETPKAYDQEIDLANLDLERSYTLEEFEYINSRLENYTLEIDGKPVNLFELDKNGKLVPMPPTPCRREQVVAEIARQLANWNIQTRQGGGITTSQGGYDFAVDHKLAIRAPDVAFMPQHVVYQLTDEQAWTFQGPPFTPTFVVEVADIGEDTDNSKFKEADKRFKEELMTQSTVVQLGWLIDPQHKQIHIYRRGRRRSSPGWGDISGENVLPGFKLDISLIDAIITLPPPTPQRPQRIRRCPDCNNTFNNNYELIKHLERFHFY
ncbi:hypothetical protein RclHR1_05830011 [Rhizophagus clarus]|uniref:C2H2-type domain-containing protein n=1 Tax=Rhizophagus clarus TaxID=94130 RepID=A0A2Z6RV52_9GLOM|nr:hypothetical protein RclHR1_05830011 [Rhizophagus clarus]GET02640.1 hypothetical protein GLOIN_2v1770913 [Rhizophagus clarus]